MYFQNFPIIYYDFDINGQRIVKVIKDITINVRIQKQLLENVTIYDEYDILDGETPEIISAKVYGSPLYHWVIMMVNQRFDYIEDFPISSKQLWNYVSDKYNDPYGVHHYVNNDGYTVSSEQPGATAVTNYDYEETINESKRRIKLVTSDYLGTIMSQLRGLM